MTEVSLNPKELTGWPGITIIQHDANGHHAYVKRQWFLHF